MKIIIALIRKMAFKSLQFCPILNSRKLLSIDHNYAAINVKLKLLGLSIIQNKNFYKFYKTF